jgi:hypothetical protein
MSGARFVDLCRDIKLLEKSFSSENALTVYASGRCVYVLVVSNSFFCFELY